MRFLQKATTGSFLPLIDPALPASLGRVKVSQSSGLAGSKPHGIEREAYLGEGGGGDGGCGGAAGGSGSGGGEGGRG
eukprot:scaffold155835_cov17-Prasinocladus_malaysianus.AAC.1